MWKICLSFFIILIVFLRSQCFQLLCCCSSSSWVAILKQTKWLPAQNVFVHAHIAVIGNHSQHNNNLFPLTEKKKSNSKITRHNLAANGMAKANVCAAQLLASCLLLLKVSMRFCYCYCIAFSVYLFIFVFAFQFCFLFLFCYHFCFGAWNCSLVRFEVMYVINFLNAFTAIYCCINVCCILLL